MKDITIYITHTFHPGKYTFLVAKTLGRNFKERGYKVHVIKVPFRETGWGNALEGRPVEEARKAPETLDYFDKFSKADTIIFDLHTGEENAFNPNDLKAEQLEFCHNQSGKHKKKGGIPHIGPTENSSERAKTPKVFTPIMFLTCFR